MFCINYIDVDHHSWHDGWPNKNQPTNALFTTVRPMRSTMPLFGCIVHMCCTPIDKLTEMFCTRDKNKMWRIYGNSRPTYLLMLIFFRAVVFGHLNFYKLNEFRIQTPIGDCVSICSEIAIFKIESLYKVRQKLMCIDVVGISQISIIIWMLSFNSNHAFALNMIVNTRNASRNFLTIIYLN